MLCIHTQQSTFTLLHSQVKAYLLELSCILTVDEEQLPRVSEWESEVAAIPGLEKKKRKDCVFRIEDNR